MKTKLSLTCAVALCAMALLALPLITSCSSVVSAVNSLSNPSSSSSAAADTYYLGIDENGNIALYKGTPGDGSVPIRTTDIVAADLHESVVAGLKEGIVFDSFNEAIERIGDYREAARTTAKARETEAASQAEAEEAAKGEAEAAAAAEADTANAVAPTQAAETAGAQEQPAQAAESQPAESQLVASDEAAPAGEFWGVWLGGFQDLGQAYAFADQAKSQGFPTEVFEVTTGGAPYVVGAGEYATKSEAQAVLERAQALGYSEAYLHTAARQ